MSLDVKKITLVIYFLAFGILPLKAQDSLLNQKNKRLNTLIYTSTIGYTAAMSGLSLAWYADNWRGEFHFFDDSQEWLQIDKIGHAYTTFHLTQAFAKALRWANIPPKKANLHALWISTAAMTSIEILDGFSERYGASWSDWGANAGGAFLYWGQMALWNEVRLVPKFSFFPTPFAEQRPELLGKNISQQWLKDYNGQTYWLSVDIDKFLPEKKFPRWLNVAVGYSAEQMIFAQYKQNTAVGLQPTRYYHLSLDWDLGAFKTKRGWLKAILYIGNLIKLPAPTLRISERGDLDFFMWYF
ncbi:MAG: DUF2279 domain-containing protein [Cytophagales bacterium]|nr:MAG: DUF2279 domain-containing protein [Cytophagales bacterium]